jgi:hypothetical protein
MLARPQLADSALTSRRGSSREEQGDSLVEILIAIVVIGICGVGILGGLTTSLASSGEHRGLAAIDTLVRSYSETVKQTVEGVPTWPSPECQGNGTGLTTWYTSNVPAWSATGQYAGYTGGYTVTLSNAQYWTGSAWSTTCPNPLTGLQKVTVTARSPGGVTDSADVVIRKQANGAA